MSLTQLRFDTPYFAEHCLEIIPKEGDIVKMRYTPTQYKIYRWLRDLEKERGEIRAIIVKPRQVRITTLLNSMEYQDAYFNPGRKILVLTHRNVVTDEVFATLKNFHDRLPEQLYVKPIKNNDDVLELPNLSKIKVALAGSDASRGFAAPIVHWSEAGRCNAAQSEDVQAGAWQTLPNGPGTIGVAESTSGGPGTYFHYLAVEGNNPKSRWQTKFIDWRQEPEYSIPPHKDWEPDDEEKELAKEFNLSFAQLYWRYTKIKDEFQGNVRKFNQEYPLTFQMAFLAAENRFIDIKFIEKARKNKLEEDKTMPRILGVDPAGKGDRTALVLRQGRKILRYWVYGNMTSTHLTGIVHRLIDQYDITKVFIDLGYGHGTYDQLRELGRFNVIGVHFGEAADRSDLYLNKRAEMAHRFRDWLKDEPTDIPDDEVFVEDIACMPDSELTTTRGLFKLVSKEELKKEIHRSPDIFDATILTFAYHVPADMENLLKPVTVTKPESSILSTKNTFDTMREDPQQQDWDERWPSGGIRWL